MFTSDLKDMIIPYPYLDGEDNLGKEVWNSYEAFQIASMLI